MGDTVYLDKTAFEITDINLFDVQLRDPTLAYPILRSEPKDRFEQLLWQDSRNGLAALRGEQHPNWSSSV